MQHSALRGALAPFTEDERALIGRAFTEIAKRLGQGEFTLVASGGRVCDLRWLAKAHLTGADNIIEAVDRLSGSAHLAPDSRS